MHSMIRTATADEVKPVLCRPHLLGDKLGAQVAVGGQLLLGAVLRAGVEERHLVAASWCQYNIPAVRSCVGMAALTHHKQGSITLLSAPHTGLPAAWHAPPLASCVDAQATRQGV